jgi:predicted secreted protein
MTRIADQFDFTRRRRLTPLDSGVAWPLYSFILRSRQSALKALRCLAFFLGTSIGAIAAAQTASVAPQTPADPPKTETYEDNFIGGDSPEGSLGQSGTDIQLDPVGYRSSTAEVKLFGTNSTRGYRESFLGAVATHRWEGLNWGDWLIEGSGVTEQSNSLFSRQTRGGRWHLQQMNMAITPRLTVSNGVGFMRSYLPSVAEYSNQGVATRFSLPGPGFLGISTQWRRDAEPLTLASTAAENRSEGGSWKLAFEGGSLTQSSGASGYAEQRNQGQTVGLHGTYQWNFNAVSALSLVRLSDSRQWQHYTAVHGEQLLLLPSLDAVVRVQAIAQNGHPAENALDASVDGSRKGFWFDAERRANIRTTRVAGWYFDRGLYWYDNLLSSGQKGLSWREEVSDSGFQWGLGAEVNQFDASVNERAGTRSYSINGSMNYRIDRAQAWTMSANFLDATPTFDDGISHTRRYLNLDFAYGLGQKRLSDQFKLVLAQSQVGGVTEEKTSRLLEILWSRSHQEFRDFEFDFTIGLGYDVQDGLKRLKPHVRMSRRWTKDGWLDGSLSFNHSRDSSSYTTSYVTGLTAMLNAKLNRELSLQLSASISSSQQTRSGEQPLFGSNALNDGFANRYQDRALWLTLRYAWAGGTSLVGNMPGSGAGFGVIRGGAFYDDNGDGIRQPDEKPAARVSISLDGVISVVTEADGSYEFPVVRSGKHLLRIDPATVRLPYGVNDEFIRNIVVTPRTTNEIAIALPKLGD